MVGLAPHGDMAGTTMRDLLTRSQSQEPGGHFEQNLTIDVVEITGRMISMTFPSEGHETTYSFKVRGVLNMLQDRFAAHLMVLNLSEKRQDLSSSIPNVKEYGWPDHMAPPLERLCSLCKAMDSWLTSEPHNVVVLHCKGGQSRIASVIAAYIHYSNICASADQAMDRFAMKRFYDDKLGGLALPSQRRYVRYFSGLLSGAIRINSSPLYLHHILIHGSPNFDTKGGCRPFIKVYQGMQPIFTSGVYNVTDNMQKVCISISPGIPLRGDILIKCYHKKIHSGQRELMWQCQYHTCTIQDNSLIFSKQELDDAVNDPRFPDNGKVEFVFGPSSDVLVSVSGFKSDVTVPVDDNEESLARSDSYENFHKALQAIDGYKNSTSTVTNHSNITNNVTHDNVTRDNVTHNSQSHQQQFSNNSSQQSTLNRRTVQQTVQQTLKERSQLDDLLKDLQIDQPPPPGSPPPVSPPAASPPSTMNGAKTVTTTTRTYTSYSTTDSHSNPDKVLIQRAEVSYKLPEAGEQTDHYIIAADPSQTLDTGRPAQPQFPKGVAPNAFSYTTLVDGGTSELQSKQQRSEVIEESLASLQSSLPPESHPPYRPGDYDGRYDTTSSSYSYSSLDGDANSWLQQQQQKLKNFKEGRDVHGRTDQEKRLVNELKFAQNKYFTTRTTQETNEQRSTVDSSYNSLLQNGTRSPDPVFTPPPEQMHSSYSTKTYTESQPQEQMHSSYSTNTYTESQSYGDKRTAANKPPPSPTLPRSPPAPVPARSSSKDYMRNRSTSNSNTNTLNSSWQKREEKTVASEQRSTHTLPNRSRPETPRSYLGSTQNTPPHSPRATSPAPTGPTSTTTYTTYRTLDRMPQERQEKVMSPPPREPTPPPAQPPTQINHHYITEVFVHRTDIKKNLDEENTDKTDATPANEEMEASNQKQNEGLLRLEELMSQANQPNQAESAPPPQPVEENIVPLVDLMEESMQTQSHQVHTYTETKPEPRVKEIEEDRIILRPIGPGMQTLEPESAHTGTLGRPTTPGFPTGPGTPQMMPQMMSGMSGGSQHGSQQILHQQNMHQQHMQPQHMQPQHMQPQHMQPQHMQPQQQTFQYQQFSQSQQYQSESHLDSSGGQSMGGQSMGGQDKDSLHIDTSHRMLHSPNSPPSPGNLNTLRSQLSSTHSMSGSVVSPGGPHSMTGQSSPSVYFGLSRRGSLSSLADSDMVHTTPKFVKDTSKFWYKAKITREEAIQLLKDKAPGTFVIRDSNSFPGAFGLALKVAQIPANVQAKPSGDPQADLVRHFLIEPTPKGVRLRGCSNEPVFGSLAALVYQHSMTPLALPCKLSLPEGEMAEVMLPPETPITNELNSAATLLNQGAACNVVFINSVDMESLTGPQAVAKAVKMTFDNLSQGKTTVVHFKVSNQGITLTDNNRKLFFRRHYPVSAVTYCGMDPQDRRWKREIDAPGVAGDARLFGFVARKQNSTNENSCHIFAELDPEQPAFAIVNFVTKVMIGQSKMK